MKFEFTHISAKSLVTNDVVMLTEFLKTLKVTNNKDKRKKLRDFVDLNLKKFKFVRNKRGGTALVFINTKEKIVVKVDGTTDIGTEAVPERAIPTAFIDAQSVIRVQPLADVSPKAVKNAYNKLSEMPVDIVGFDCHEGNVGKYKNKFVVIDW
jgi:hypothetical protein